MSVAAAHHHPPDSAALRAATVSFQKKPVPVAATSRDDATSPARSASRASFASSSTTPDRSTVSPIDLGRCPPRKPSPKDRDRKSVDLSRASSLHHHHQHTPSEIAASLAFARRSVSPTKMTEQEQEQALSIAARRKLFQCGEEPSKIGREGPPPLHKISPEHSRPGSPAKEKAERLVEDAPVEDIRSIREKFEGGKKSSSAPPVQAPKPVRPPPTSESQSMAAALLATQMTPRAGTPAERTESPGKRNAPSPPKRKPVPSAAGSASPKPKQGPPVAPRLASKPSRDSVASIQTTSTAQTVMTATTVGTVSTAPTSVAPSTADLQSQRAAAPKPPPPRKGGRTPQNETGASSPPVSQSPKPKPAPSLPARATTTSPALSAALHSTQPSSTSLPDLKPAQTGSSASTIAASLAPSHAVSPGPKKDPKPTPPPPRRQPSPQKHIPTTLRPERPRSTSPPPSSSHHFLPHHHHHNAAKDKRYHRTISPRAIRRYEALWAANRGYLLPPAQSSCVCNIVVRELWRRSRLGEHVLAEIWDAVDRERRGWLGREEFVVGMWLVDQALMGRKCVRRIPESVFEALRQGSTRVPVPPAPRGAGK